MDRGRLVTLLVTFLYGCRQLTAGRRTYKNRHVIPTLMRGRRRLIAFELGGGSIERPNLRLGRLNHTPNMTPVTLTVLT